MVDQELNCIAPALDEATGTLEPHKILPIPKEDLLRIEVKIVDVLSNYTVPGVLVGFTPGEVAVFVGEPLSEQRAVTVQLNSFSFEGQTLYCAPYENQFEIHVSIDDLEDTGMRRSPRFPVSIPADLMRPNGDPVAITIRDISREGMGIELPVPLAVGQPVAIASGPAFLFAVVRHCKTIAPNSFRAGVEMHHLFERPLPPVEPPQPSVLRSVWRCFSRRDESASTSKLLRVAE